MQGKHQIFNCYNNGILLSQNKEIFHFFRILIEKRLNVKFSLIKVLIFANFLIIFFLIVKTINKGFSIRVPHKIIILILTNIIRFALFFKIIFKSYLKILIIFIQRMLFFIFQGQRKIFFIQNVNSSVFFIFTYLICS